MSSASLMRRFAKWHIWLGWLVGIPIFMWTLSGFAMVLKPIEEVRGENRRITVAPRPIPADAKLIKSLGTSAGVVELTQRFEGDDLIAIFKFADGRESRFSLTRQVALEGRYGVAQARDIVAREIRGGGNVATVEFFAAGQAPAEFRKPVPAWRVALADGTHVYVGSVSGRIEAIRTRWWRFYDFMWGLHIMDLQTREDTHHPTLIAFAGLSVIGTLLGCVLMFRRRKARVVAP